MIRYVAAGLAMMAGFVLLFMASFGSQRSPAPPPVPLAVEHKQAAASADQAPIAPVPTDMSGATPSPEALAALQAQIHDAARTMTVLQNEVSQTRQDLASLQSQKKQAQDAARSVAATPAGAPAAVAGSGAATAGVPAPRVQAPTAPSRPPDVPRAQATQPVGFASRGRLAEPRSPEVRPLEPRSGDSRPPERRVADAGAADGRRGEERPPAQDGGPSATDVLNRLRQQVPGPGQQVPGPVGETPLPARAPQAVVTSPVGPHRIPASDRLADARTAVVEGRIEDARRFLQAAQVQLVFRPVDVGEAEPPRASQAAGPVAQALSALGYGDRDRALVAIDQALGALASSGRAVQQFGALPPAGGSAGVSGGDFDGRGSPPTISRSQP